MNYIGELQAYRDREIEVYKRIDLESVNTVMNVLEEARLTGRHIFICGNGGSSATSSHYTGDFNKGVNIGLLGVGRHCTDGIPRAEKMNGIPLYNFECLSDNIPTMMAVSNDESYAEVFRFPLSVKMKAGDVVIGISGTGNSANVVNAMEYAKEHGGTTIAIVGYNGGRIKETADYNIHVEINDMQIVEDLHMVLDHMMMWVLSHGKGC